MGQWPMEVFSGSLIMTIQQLLQIVGSFLIQIWEAVMVPKIPAAWLHLLKTKDFFSYRSLQSQRKRLESNTDNRSYPMFVSNEPAFGNNQG